MEKKDFIEEYEKHIENHKEYKDMIRESLELLDRSLRRSPLGVLAVIDLLIPLAQKEGDQISIAIMYVQKGWVQIDLAQYGEALESFDLSANIFIGMKHELGLIRAYNGMGFAFMKIGNIIEALGSFDKAIALALPLEDKGGLAMLYGNVGETFLVLDNYEEAIKYFNKVLELEPIEAIKGVVLEGLGSTYYRLGDKEKALAYLLEAKAITDPHNLILMSHIFTSLGTVYESMGEYERAIEVSYEAKKITGKAKLPRFQGDVFLTLARIFLKTNKKEQAKNYFQKAFELGRQVQDSSLLSEAAKHLAELGKEEKNWQDAYNYFLEHYTETEKLANEKTAKEIQRLKLNEANREIELLTKMHQQVSMISQMGKEITSSLNLEEVLFTIHNILVKLMDIKIFGVGFYRERHNELVIQLAVRNNENLQPIVLNLAKEDSLAIKCFKSKQGIIINDFDKEYKEHFSSIHPARPEELEDIQSLIFLPLEVNNKLIGVITVQSENKDAYDEYKVEMIKALASYIAIALENSNLYEKVERMATCDSVTNIYNRAFFINLAEKEFKKFKRNGPLFSLLMFDLDHFKSINDQFGHDAGDIALRQVAYVCKERLREADLFCRYGGDEFMVLLAETNLEKARLVAEELLATINKIKISLEQDKTFNLQASFGITSAQLDDSSLKEILKRVDVALYQAKNAGRNRVSSY